MNVNIYSLKLLRHVSSFNECKYIFVKHECICAINIDKCKTNSHKCMCVINPNKCKFMGFIMRYDRYDNINTYQTSKDQHMCICSENTVKCRNNNEHKCICKINSEICVSKYHECMCKININKCRETSKYHYCICINNPEQCKVPKNISACLFDIYHYKRCKCGNPNYLWKDYCEIYNHDCICEVNSQKCNKFHIETYVPKKKFLN